MEGQIQRLRPTKEQLKASIRTGVESARWFEEHGCPRQAALIRSRIEQWEDRLQRGDHR